MKLINDILKKANLFLGEKYKPFMEFEQFEEDEMPTNSDVTLILSQYIEAIEKFRSDNIFSDLGKWYYKTSDSSVRVRTFQPAKLGKR